ncbi:hypothetical protein DID88_008288 [Monilinia fructigena]|uniref:Uncharacterized protein n=1 Tax=Monilinia fructigena TaxID=38457 RepID=A0A395J7A9_9HELO|nr:hypothetical protein DID88_008288 [Monilinia fructigena]
MVADSDRAKYIEGLENRLGRMESLLKLSGLLNEEDGGRTDLGTLEKRLPKRTFRAERLLCLAQAATSPSQSTSGAPFDAKWIDPLSISVARTNKDPRSVKMVETGRVRRSRSLLSVIRQ